MGSRIRNSRAQSARDRDWRKRQQKTLEAVREAARERTRLAKEHEALARAVGRIEERDQAEAQLAKIRQDVGGDLQPEAARERLRALQAGITVAKAEAEKHRERLQRFLDAGSRPDPCGSRRHDIEQRLNRLLERAMHRLGEARREYDVLLTYLAASEDLEEVRGEADVALAAAEHVEALARRG